MYFETKGLVSIKGGKGLLAGTSTTAPTTVILYMYRILIKVSIKSKPHV